MRVRTQQYALNIMQLVSTLPRGYVSDVIGRQLVRCATSVGANYCAACRARSSADFIAKMKIVEEEADESIYWMELLQEGGVARSERLQPLLTEGNEIVAIVVASIKTKRAQT
ncbi:MAG TPA: four helix bundle protein [Abditibacteriaceae bacterium]|jgi:four helix bundle protein